MDIKILRALSRESGLGEKAIERLLNSVRVLRDRPSEKDPSPPMLELGLRLVAPLREKLVRGSPIAPATLAALGAVLREYGGACPQVTMWVGRGDFDPSKRPTLITATLITHACRTAGRLRAKAIRSAPELASPG